MPRAYGTAGGVTYSAQQVHEFFPHLLPLMRTRPDGGSILSGGYYASYSAGLAEGALATTRRWMYAVARTRLPEPEPQIRRALDETTNLEGLEQIAARARKAATWQQALAPG